VPVRQLALAAFFAALIALLAQIAIPLPFSPVPLTGQLLGIFLAAALLGGRAGALAVLAYVLLGAAGAPVFHAGRGGLALLLGPTGGYLLGFIAGTYLAGRLLERHPQSGMLRTAAALAACLGATYLLGTLQLALVLGLSWPRALLLGIAPYLPLDLAKLLIAAGLSVRLRRILHRHGLLLPVQPRFQAASGSSPAPPGPGGRHPGPR
jgi:biotin transport system substrate-specific component